MGNKEKIFSTEQLKKFREGKGWTQEEFARKLGVSFVTINRWETGENKPRGIYLRELMKFMAKGEK